MKKFFVILAALSLAVVLSACKKATTTGTTADPNRLASEKYTYSSYTFGTFVVVNGTIVLADINAAYPLYQFVVDSNGKFVKTVEGDKSYNTILMVPKKDSSGTVVEGQFVPAKSFLTKDSAGNWYGMSQIGKTEWSDQMKLVEAKILADQALNITVTDGSGKIDGLASVSVGHSVATVKEILDKLAADTTVPVTHPATTVLPNVDAAKAADGKADGFYFAAGEFEGGYRYYVVVTVADGLITNVEWNGYHIDGGAAKCKGEDKFTCAADGKYGMNNPASGSTTDKGKGTWDDQSKAATDYIVQTQNLNPTFTDGVADTITSVTVSSDVLFNLVKEALEGSAVPAGTHGYADGYYYVESAKSNAEITYGKYVGSN